MLLTTPESYEIALGKGAIDPAATLRILDEAHLTAQAPKMQKHVATFGPNTFMFTATPAITKGRRDFAAQFSSFGIRFNARIHRGWDSRSDTTVHLPGRRRGRQNTSPLNWPWILSVAAAKHLLCATTVAKGNHGIDIPDLDALIVIGPQGEVWRVAQWIGRINRPGGQIVIAAEILPDVIPRNKQLASIFEPYGMLNEEITPGYYIGPSDDTYKDKLPPEKNSLRRHLCLCLAIPLRTNDASKTLTLHYHDHMAALITQKLRIFQTKDKLAHIRRLKYDKLKELMLGWDKGGK